LTSLEIIDDKGLPAQPAYNLDVAVDVPIDSSDPRSLFPDGLFTSLKSTSELRVHQNQQWLLPVSRNKAQGQECNDGGPSPCWANVSSNDASLNRSAGNANGDAKRDDPVELDVAEYRVAGPLQEAGR
jgi:hypothetical protein